MDEHDSVILTCTPQGVSVQHWFQSINCSGNGAVAARQWLAPSGWDYSQRSDALVTSFVAPPNLVHSLIGEIFSALCQEADTAGERSLVFAGSRLQVEYFDSATCSGKAYALASMQLGAASCGINSNIRFSTMECSPDGEFVMQIQYAEQRSDARCAPQLWRNATVFARGGCYRFDKKLGVVTTSAFARFTCPPKALIPPVPIQPWPPRPADVAASYEDCADDRCL
jgi:hypothetical protein